jgi:hypothetical protein
MSLLVNVLLALGIVIGAYLLLFVCVWAVMARRFGAGWIAEVGVTWHGSPVAAALLYLLVPFALALGALSLPPVGRLWAAAGGGLLLLSLLACVAARIARIPRG